MQLQMPLRPVMTLLFLVALSTGQMPAQSAGNSFYNVIRNNDSPALKLALRKSGGAGVRELRGTTPLMYAAALGSLEAMKMVVEAGADVNAKNDFGATALMWCAGDLEKVRYLLAKGASVTARSDVGRTPLLIAANYDGSVEIARLMIAKGADVSAKDKSGTSVLEAAASVNNLEFARLLLDKGADPNTIDEGGFTALGMAASNGDRSAPLVKLLLEHGAAVNVVSADTLETVKNGKIRLGRLTPLLMATPQASYETVELLVKAGAKVNAQDIRGMTPLELAVATDHADPRIVRLLLSKGADPAIKSTDGETAADWARKFGQNEVLEALGLPRQSPGNVALEQAAPASSRSVQAALESSVALLQRNSAKFLEAGGCVSCHAQHQTRLAVAAAKASGVKVDWTLETEQARSTALLRGAFEQTFYQVVDPVAGIDSQEISIMQMSAAGLPPKLSTDALVFHIAAMQRKEGDWPNYGSVRPPLEDGGFSHTARGIRALQLNSLSGRKAEFEERIARATHWLEQASPVTAEDRTMQLLGICWANRKAPQARVDELIALQRPDGGWGQSDNLASDAYATGEALSALHETGMAATHEVYRRGVDFLLRTQLEDGSWLVKTRAAGFQPYFQSGFPHDHNQWISQSGTAWAAMALSVAVQPRGSVVAANTGAQFDSRDVNAGAQH
jgi:ankyrin repeat protein